MAHLLEKVQVGDYRCSLNGNTEGATACSGLVKLSQIQFHAITAVRNADVVGKVTIAFGLEYRAAIGDVVRCGIGGAAGKVTIRSVIDVFIRSAALGSTYVYGGYHISRIRWDVTAGFRRDLTNFIAILGTPTVIIRVGADVTANRIAAYKVAIHRACIDFGHFQHFFGVALAHDTHRSRVPVQLVTLVPQGRTILGAG